MNVHSKKMAVDGNPAEKHFTYYVNDGVYGAFNGVLIEGMKPIPYTVKVCSLTPWLAGWPHSQAVPVVLASFQAGHCPRLASLLLQAGLIPRLSQAGLIPRLSQAGLIPGWSHSSCRLASLYFYTQSNW